MCQQKRLSGLELKNKALVSGTFSIIAEQAEYRAFSTDRRIAFLFFEKLL